ncbi:hypothetical protein HB662_10035 [Roseomonas frigidaquae]|uniref:PEGA domain-containing protein n=1 Tax=Falsiroseomonas frigidaquae TaxID=487318 RepID=A0ABX1EYJ9_9PROT|nr:hypothetical protein [Falsiroseomonas frigidaquae]NKE45119.1 hypothetical protein [Falsiroseomonas frigidaquae]
MPRLLRLVALLSIALLPACATVTSGTSQSLAIQTEPTGAACTVSRQGAVIGTVGATPGSVEISKSRQDLAVACTRRDFLPASQVVVAEAQVMTAGNILLGGVIGLAVDAATGAMTRYPTSVSLILPPSRFASEAERDGFFAGRAAETRRRHAERLQALTSQCAVIGPDACDTQTRALEAERDAALVELERQRGVTTTG